MARTESDQPRLHSSRTRDIDVQPDKEHLRALAEELYDPRSTAARIVVLLRTWPT